MIEKQLEKYKNIQNKNVLYMYLYMYIYLYLDLDRSIYTHDWRLLNIVRQFTYKNNDKMIYVVSGEPA